MPARYRVDDTNVAWRVADDEAVVLHADSSAYFGLNQVGTLLWLELVRQPMTPEQLTIWARNLFPDTPQGLQEEISAFLDALLELNLIGPDDGPEPPAPRAAPNLTEGSELPAWEAPAVERYGELEKLILSGE